MCPASILERSRMSLMIWSRCDPFRRIPCRAASRLVCGSLGSRRISAKPRTATMGVRTSWLMLARNEAFA